MKYNWRFKLQCVENRKGGIPNSIPEYSKISQREFNHRVRDWERIFDQYGIDGLKHKIKNKEWSAEEKVDLIAKVLAGNSIKSTAVEAGNNNGQLYSWIKKYKQFGYDGLKCTKRGRPPKERPFMKKTENKPIKLSKNEREELIMLKRRTEYLEAENAYLKKIKALAIQKTARAKAKKQPSLKASLKKDIK